MSRRYVHGLVLDDATLDACARYRDGDVSDEVLLLLQPVIRAALGWAVDHALDLRGHAWWHTPAAMRRAYAALPAKARAVLSRRR